MRLIPWITRVLLGASLASAAGTQKPLGSARLTSTSGSSVPLDLAPHFNNKGTSSNGKNDGKGFGDGETYATEYLPTGTWRHDGVEFALPEDWDALDRDNVRVSGQAVELDNPVEVVSVHLLGVGEDTGGFNHGESHEVLRVTYDDGTEDEIPFTVKNWWNHHWMNKGPIRAPYHYIGDGSKNYNATHIFHTPLRLPPTSAGKQLRSITLPAENKDWNSYHLFATSYIPVAKEKREGTPEPAERVAVRAVHATRRWEDVNGKRGQVVEVVLANPLSGSRTGEKKAWYETPFRVSLIGDGFRTLRYPSVKRLMPGDEVVVEVLVQPTGKETEFKNVRVRIDDDARPFSHPAVVEGSGLVHDFSAWEATDADVELHSAPKWWRDAKFGIFVHYGLFSIPGWGDGTRYAEWYNFWLHDDPADGPTRKHHAEAFGEDFVYDDFIAQHTAEKFDASELVRLFNDAGAKYFVFTTKHHDGYALFDTKDTSDRNSLKFGPKRDLLREVFDAAKQLTPDLKRGTYFSLPEWYSPLYAPHGRVSFPGGPAFNPYKPDEKEPYTGFIDKEDFINDIQVEQMRILANDYGTDIIWGDIGLDNASVPFVAEWYAQAARDGRQVATNNRLGIGGDFDSPEMMASFNHVPAAWESCASMDPESFGWNRETKDKDYRSADDVIRTLVDITAKGGNFLLNIGPRGDGSIPDVVTEALRGAGEWLAVNGRAIYNTRPYTLMPSLKTPSTDIYFTRTADAMYITTLQAPSWPVFKIQAPLPVMPCDKVFLLTKARDVLVPWTYHGGVLKLNTAGLPRDTVGGLDEQEPNVGGVKAWVFEIQYGRCGADHLPVKESLEDVIKNNPEAYLGGEKRPQGPNKGGMGMGMGGEAERPEWVKEMDRKAAAKAKAEDRLAARGKESTGKDEL